MAEQKQKRPNILVIWGDDIGYWNLSCHSRGMMGYHTPNIDRIANEGTLFTDCYGEQSCTAGRSVFITGQRALSTCCSAPLSVTYSGHEYLNPYLQEPPVST